MWDLTPWCSFMICSMVCLLFYDNPGSLVLIYYLFQGDGFIGIEEFRYDCVNRQAISDLKELDKAFTTISENGGVTR